MEIPVTVHVEARAVPVGGRWIPFITEALRRARRGGRSTIDRDKRWLTRFENEVLPLFEADGHAPLLGSNDPPEVESRNEQIRHLIWVLVQDGEVPSDWMDDSVLPAKVDTVDRALRRASK